MRMHVRFVSNVSHVGMFLIYNINFHYILNLIFKNKEYCIYGTESLCLRLPVILTSVVDHRKL